MNNNETHTQKPQITEAQSDKVLRTNLHDSRYMETVLEYGGDEHFRAMELSFSLRKLLMFGTLEEKLKISHP